MATTEFRNQDFINLPQLSSEKSGKKIEENYHRVLMVEDNLINQKVASVYLDEWGCKELDIASTGHRALTLSKKQYYSLILIDIGLPDISGIEVCKSIRSSSINKSTPVIAITAHLEDEITKKCLAAGCNSVFCKPVEFNLLQNCLIDLLQVNS